MRFVLCQISNKMINPDVGKRETVADDFYESLYQSKESVGYYRPEHFFELPLWIGEMTHTLVGKVNIELNIITVAEPFPEYEDDEQTVYCFSVLDVNKGFISDIIDINRGCSFLLGGYINKSEIDKPNAIWADSIEDACKMYDIEYAFGTNWTLFNGEQCIPRLTLSYGCTHRCKFCTVPDAITEVSLEDIVKQAYALAPLKFKLVYINDKTFGQAKNWSLLKQANEIIKSVNPYFEGFIVQTSVPVSLNANLLLWKEYGVKIVELGVETVNDELLKRYRKPQTEEMITSAVQMLDGFGFDVIANLILGLMGETGETYLKTVKFLTDFSKKLFALNIYTLALYNDTELADEIEVLSEDDSNELSTDRTFWNSEEKNLYEKFSEDMYRIGISITSVDTSQLMQRVA